MGKLKTPKKNVGRIVPWFFIGVVVLGLSGGLGWWVASQQRAAMQKPAPIADAPKAPNAQDGNIRLIATGDMLAHDSVNNNAKTGQDYDYTKYFANVQTFTQNGDIRFCNQEGLSAGETYGITGYPTFNAPKQFSRDLQKIGCNTINLANNHMADKGQLAVDETIATWEELKPLALSGANRTAAERDTVRYLEAKGVKVAFLTFNEINNNVSAPEHTVTLLNEANVTKLVTEARNSAQFVMVSVHWGNYENSTHVGPIEEQWVKRITELGADVIIGTGPHVLQRAEWRNGSDGRKTFVWYSLGNFLSTQYESITQLIGGIAVMKLEKTSDEKVPVKIAKVGFLPTYMHYDWPAQDRVAEKLETRTNLMLYPLDKAADPLSRSGFKTTLAEQQKIVRETLGPDVTILTAQSANAF